MSSIFGTLKYKVACTAIAVGLALPAGLAFAGERVTTDSIINALTPKRPLTRSLAITPAAPAPAAAARDNTTDQFINSLRNRNARSLTMDERTHIAAIAKDKPRIDLEIRFDFNSANISRSAMGDVESLGKALADPKLKGNSFVLAGHTDGVGGDEYNQELSERRADAVKQYLVSRFGLAPDRLLTVGYGKSQLKDPSHPSSAANRRVGIVNMDDRVEKAEK